MDHPGGFSSVDGHGSTSSAFRMAGGGSRYGDVLSAPPEASPGAIPTSPMATRRQAVSTAAPWETRKPRRMRRIASVTRWGRQTVPGGEFALSRRFEHDPPLRPTGSRRQFADAGLAERARTAGRVDAVMTMSTNPPAGTFTFDSALKNAPRVTFSRAGRSSGGPARSDETPGASKYRPLTGTVGEFSVPVTGWRSLRRTAIGKAPRVFGLDKVSSAGPGPKYLPPLPQHKRRTAATEFGKAPRFRASARRGGPGPSVYKEITRGAPKFSFGTASRF